MKLSKEKKEQEKLKAKMPVGTRLMSEEERVQTLEELRKNRAAVNDMLMSMPLSMRTDALKNKKKELENKLSELEKAIGNFSRKVVYIAETAQE